jgi:hypothetical protein|tara:strand:+ start:308 stop:496 length:189 start_codon:yes stop_codon:yes gene_type:complete
MNHEILKRLYITENHLNMALKALKEEANDEVRTIIFTALSSVGQLQEILEQEAFDDFQNRRV